MFVKLATVLVVIGFFQLIVCEEKVKKFDEISHTPYNAEIDFEFEDQTEADFGAPQPYLEHEDDFTSAPDPDSFFTRLKSFMVGSYQTCIKFAVVAAILLLTWRILDIPTPNDMVYGVPFHKNLTKVSWPKNEEGGCCLRVSNTKTINVSFTNYNGETIMNPLAEGNLSVEILCNGIIESRTALLESSGNLQIVFNATRAGTYKVTLKSNRYCVRGFPTSKSILAGDIDGQSLFFHQLRSHTLVLKSGVPEDIQLDPRDKYNNELERHRLPDLIPRISFQLYYIDPTDGGRKRENKVNFLIYQTVNTNTLNISVAFSPSEEGWYEARVLLDEEPIARTQSPLTLIVLSRNEHSKVEQILSNRKSKDFFALESDYFEGDLICQNGQEIKPKKVYCYLTDKQLAIREFFLKIFHKRTFGYRLVPATSLKLIRYQANFPVIKVEDGYGNLEICIKDGVVFASCFHKIILEKLGGSETFNDKTIHFHNMLQNFHERKGNKHVHQTIKISRHPSILKSTYQATKYMSDHDWAKLFVIEFDQEVGIDQGGLRREWAHKVGIELFSPEKWDLFKEIEEGSGAVMPNKNPPMNSKRKQMYRFAGKFVGKVLYEASHGSTYSHFLSIRLAKSFLAQLVGLRVHYRHFEFDAPEYYTAKINYIEKNDVSDLDLVFAEEEIIHSNNNTNNSNVGSKTLNTRIVDLKHNGRNIEVTEDNKMEYLTLLAHYRLSSSVKEQIECFMEGLHTFVPDSLLSMFDENELELLLCGVSMYDLSELKRHYRFINDGLSYKTLEWFWLALSHFTSEQFARLMQFTTGSSQLPAGGFAAMNPKFQICSNPRSDGLPTAHTCFNMICLSEHSSFENFEKSLLIAITEGAEGFGLA